MSTPIPQPPGYFLVGNISDVDPKDSIGSINRLSEKYGEIFKLSLFGSDRYFLCSERLVQEVCDENRFVKKINAGLEQVRNGVGDGLFTAYNDEHSWGVAHRTLVPAFGPIGIQHMYDEMYDIATQLVSKWARSDPEDSIHVTDDFTRLTLDSIALCAMDKRFNSFYHEEMHPFVDAMSEFLVESGARSRKTRLELMLNRAPTVRYESNIALMKSVAQEVVDRRRRIPSEKKDLLNAMLFGKDPKTGERLSDDTIMNNMITFLIAGHETTSGLLSFATYFLLKNPEALQRAQQEVDDVVGKGPIKFQHMSKLPYIEAVLREALRLTPTAPAFSVTPKPGTTEPVIIGGQYLIPPNSTLICFLSKSQRDPGVYGSDADEFKPERMLADKFEKLPSGSWKPFGNGARGCIGRPFAWQEAILTLALVLQNFNVRLADSSYQLKIKQTLTIKPDNLYIKVSLRPGIDPITIEKKMFGDVEAAKDDRKKTASNAVGAGDLKPMTVLYGSNSGTCEGLAQKLASMGGSQGFEATVKPLDSGVDRFPLDQPVVIISASYEGLPPDNAALFVQWLKSSSSAKFKGAECAVFGCGHRDWVTTYQKIPTLIEDELSGKGANIIIPRGETNVAAGTIFDDFDGWSDRLWSALGSKSAAVVGGLEMELSSSSRATHLRYSVQDALILKNELLTSGGGIPEKRYTEFKLPTSVTYEAGDYLALLPMNGLSVVSRVLRRFKLPWDATMKLKKGSHSTIPTDVEMSVSTVLASYVELNAPNTRKNLQTLASYAGDAKLDAAEGTGQSALDVLEANPELPVPFAVYLSMLAPMRIRQYSISSSPLSDPTIATITFSLASDTGVSSKAHPGVATHYLKSLSPGSTVQVAIRKSPAPFHPPVDPSVPVIMMCAGSGIAPFRGFVQDRAIKLSTSNAPETFAPAVLIIGCRDPKLDKIHASELEKWQNQGAVKVYYAYSRASEQSDGCKYAQHRLWRERKEIGELFSKGARVYICGSSALGKGVGETAQRMVVEYSKEMKGKDMSEDEARKWWEGLRGERYAVDVFD
ncbi:hypothetical protein OHC33_010824 [Knufia fluminis]|uniref:Bifunctional cytochrome P450/NADPH--P450 reductase n=1 Tax=Knufia fluminis TaxID=191047 RepID=A0AAN8I3B6_9EURO|nr:hypothetical protein OHC33_010824 [Knufia fluminis]